AQGPESDPTNPLFNQVGKNVLKGRLRSHPDVAARHYGEPARLPRTESEAIPA
ncbi:MAG: isopenicillin N synthase family oxygenase, partial [Aeromonas veronii]